MDELEKLFEENKESFDRLDPMQEGWNSIVDSLVVPQIQAKNKFTFFKIAAVVVLLIGVSSLLFVDFNSGLVEFQNVSMSSPEGEPVPLDPTIK